MTETAEIQEIRERVKASVSQRRYAWDVSKADKALIANARTDLPTLLAEIDRLQAKFNTAKNPGCDATCLNYCWCTDPQVSDDMKELQADNERLRSALERLLKDASLEWYIGQMSIERALKPGETGVAVKVHNREMEQRAASAYQNAHQVLLSHGGEDV